MADQPAPVYRINVDTSEFTPLPEFGGSQCLLYRSPDSRRIAGSFRETGSHTFTTDYDEFIYVITGRVGVTVEGGERHEMGAGDAFYLLEGTTVTMEMSSDFRDVAVLISDTPIAL